MDIFNEDEPEKLPTASKFDTKYLVVAYHVFVLVSGYIRVGNKLT